MMDKVRLGDIAKISSGGTPSRNKRENWENGDIPWIKIKDLKSKYINSSEENITKYALKNSTTKLYKKGTILYTIFATIGEVAILNIDATTNQAIAGIEINEKVINRDYLFYYLNSIKPKMVKKSRGVAQNNINLKILKNLEIKLVELSEQEKIANKLGKVREIIDLRKKQIEELDELIKSQFVKMFDNNSYEKITVKKAIEKKYIEKPLDGNHGNKHPKANDYVKSGVPFLMANNIENGYVDLVNCNFIKKEQADSLDKGFAKNNDVLITHKGTIGKTAILHTDYEYVMLTPQITYYRTNEKYLLPEYLKAYFDSEKFQSILKNLAGSGSTRAYIGITEQQKLELIVPPRELQLNFMRIVKLIDKQKSILEKNLEKITKLQESLMNKYFGE